MRSPMRWLALAMMGLCLVLVQALQHQATELDELRQQQRTHHREIRVVESQLPAGVSSVAVGPLVVLGLIVDAVRAAGALMAVPWLLLTIYMVGLLRGKIPLETER